jgi:hypothetical protein
MTTPGEDHPAYSPFGTEQVILPDHFGQALGPKAVRQRARRILGQAARFKEIAHAADISCIRLLGMGKCVLAGPSLPLARSA